MLQIHQFPCLSDNYGFLLHDPDSGETAAIDTPDGAEYLRQADARGWRITRIWNTHWHPDHTGGNAAIVEATGAPVLAPAEVERITPVDQLVAHGERFTFGRWYVHVIDVSGHTNGHVAFHLPEARLAFVGDSVFPLGCGRMFEGTYADFWHSLERLAALPNEARVYCGHDYTLSNARFALAVDPGNETLKARAAEAEAAKAQGRFLVPSTIGQEKASNPFLRAGEPALAKSVHKEGAQPVEVFGALREWKNRF